jgi:large subunit ribosomal protein L13
MSMENLATKWGGGEVLRRAVRGMLPKNKLRDVRLARLRGMLVDILVDERLINTVFEGPKHPYVKNLVQYPGSDVQRLVPEAPKWTEQKWLGDVKI